MSAPYRHRPPAQREGVPPPQRDEIDALVEAVSAGARATTLTGADTNDAPRVALSPARSSWRLPFPPRIVVVIAAFVAGVAGAVWTLRTLDPGPAHESSTEATPLLASRTLARPIPLAAAPSPSLTADDLEAARAQSAATSVDEIAAHIDLPFRDVTVRADPSLRVRPSTPEAARPIAPTPAPTTPSAPGAVSSDAVVVETTTLVGAPVEAAPAAPPATVERRAVAVGSETAAESAVLETVADYRRALEQLDVDATAELWPSVDRRMLARAFSSLKAQELSFDTCDVMLGGSAATARCQGTAQYVVKVGSAGARVGRFEWLFSMRKRGDAWKIDGVTAAPLASAGRDQQ